MHRQMIEKLCHNQFTKIHGRYEIGNGPFCAILKSVTPTRANFDLFFQSVTMRSGSNLRTVVISPIYSHTSAFYCAFYNLQCSFIPKPLVIFNHNEMEMEHEKLETRNKVFNKPSLYHACVGLGKHLEYMSLKTGCDLKQIANSAEDEIYKDSKNIKKTITIFFIFAFAIQQMRHEVKSYNNFNNNSFYLTAEDVEFLRYIFTLLSGDLVK